MREKRRKNSFGLIEDMHLFQILAMGVKLIAIFFLVMGWVASTNTPVIASGEIAYSSKFSTLIPCSVEGTIDTPEFIILENKVPRGSKKITISGLVVDKNENPIGGATILVRAGKEKVVKGGGQVNKNGRFSIEMAKESDPQLPYFVEIHNLEYESASVPIKGTISSEIGIQLARLEGSRDPTDNELTPEIPFHERFFKNLITPYQKLKGVLRIN